MNKTNYISNYILENAERGLPKTGYTYRHAIKLKKTFHEYNLDDSVDGARSYAMLSYGKKRRGVDTFDGLSYTMAMTTDKSGIMLPPYEDAFREHVLCAKFHDLIWCKSHIPNQELIEPVGHSWSACDDGLITPTIHNNAPVEFRNVTHRYCTERECVGASKCPCLLDGP